VTYRFEWRTTTSYPSLSRHGINPPADRQRCGNLELGVNPAEQTAELTELDRNACLCLIAKGVVGRVVFTDAALPAVQPVMYLLDGEEIVFRALNGTKLAVDRHVIAFQADEVDPDTATGWSVVGIGQAYEVTNPSRLDELAKHQPAAWASIPTAHTIAIPLRHLAGHRLSLNPEAS